MAKEKSSPSLKTTRKSDQKKERKLAKFSIGDRIKVFFTITEGKQIREAFFEGQVIAQKGTGKGKTFTVRKIAADRVPVERIFPKSSPKITKIDLVEKGKGIRRAKLYYLRNRIGR
ncbi:MAG: 50S ribosomal protein L19 [Candidatus Shapirobacteria bacterium]|nr:50S ribosomal protein L19 [Candidatus Shapirobacteria bacterium]